MTDSTTTSAPVDAQTLSIDTDITTSSSFVPENIHWHDCQTEINNYYINYIDDLSTQPELITPEINEDIRSMSAVERSSCRLEVSQLGEEVTTVSIK